MKIIFSTLLILLLSNVLLAQTARASAEGYRKASKYMVATDEMKIKTHRVKRKIASAHKKNKDKKISQKSKTAKKS